MMLAIQWVDVHATVILLAGLLPLLVLLKYRGRAKVEAVQWSSCVAPVLVLGTAASLLLNVHGAPFAEWLLPAVATVVIATFVPNTRARYLTCLACFVAAAALCYDFLEITQWGYTTNPSVLKLLSIHENGGAMSRGTAVVESRISPDGNIPMGRIERDLNGVPLEARIPTLVRLWHTPWTRLYLIKWEPGSIWSTGEQVNGRPIVEIRRESTGASSIRSPKDSHA
jgi:hypothetical protein